MRSRHVIALAAALLVAAATLAAPVIPVPEGRVEGEFWEMKNKMVMEGMPMQMPMQTTKICRAKNAPDEQLASSDDKNCRMTSQKHVGNKFYWEVECTGEEAYSGKGEFERLGPDQYRGKMTMVMQEGTATMEMEGRKLGGTCDPYAEMRKANAAMAQGEVQACRNLGEDLGDPATDPRFGSADYGCLTRNKKAYSDGVNAFLDTTRRGRRCRWSSRWCGSGRRRGSGRGCCWRAVGGNDASDCRAEGGRWT